MDKIEWNLSELTASATSVSRKLLVKIKTLHKHPSLTMISHLMAATVKNCILIIYLRTVLSRLKNLSQSKFAWYWQATERTKTKLKNSSLQCVSATTGRGRFDTHNRKLKNNTSRVSIQRMKRSFSSLTSLVSRLNLGKITLSALRSKARTKATTFDLKSSWQDAFVLRTSGLLLRSSRAATAKVAAST
jgi:hypothetical protein